MSDPQRDNPKWGLSEVLHLSVPASLSGLNRVATQFIDGLMIACLGSATISGQAMGGLVSFTFESFPRGVLSVVNTYVSQNLGAGRHSRCAQYTWAGLLVALLFSILICPLALAAGGLFGLIGHEADVQAMEVIYFRYMVLSAPLALAIRVLEGFFYGVRRPRIVYAASLIASLVNIGGNWVLIFGKLGLPALGLHGAGIASVLSWVLQLLILACVFLSVRFHGRFRTRLARAARLRQCGRILRIGLPAGANFFVDIFAWSVFMNVLVGHFGKLHLSAASVAMRYMRISFIPAIGIGIAATVLVGRYIGQGAPNLAQRMAHTAVLTAMIYMGCCGLAFILFGRPMMHLFLGSRAQAAYTPQEAAQIVFIGRRILIFMALFQLADAACIVFNGSLRGAGDTRWPMFATGICSFLILVCGGTAIVHFLPHLGSLGPFGAAAASTIALAGLLAWRFESGAWKRIDLLGKARPASAVPAKPASAAPPTVITVENPEPNEADG